MLRIKQMTRRAQASLVLHSKRTAFLYHMHMIQSSDVCYPKE